MLISSSSSLVSARAYYCSSIIPKRFVISFPYVLSHSRSPRPGDARTPQSPRNSGITTAYIIRLANKPIFSSVPPFDRLPFDRASRCLLESSFLNSMHVSYFCDAGLTVFPEMQVRLPCSRYCVNLLVDRVPDHQCRQQAQSLWNQIPST